MCKQECPSADACILRSSLENQATRSGYKDATLTPGETGPYWDSGAWRHQVDESMRIARRAECPVQPELKKDAELYTRRKIERREFVDPSEQK